MNEERGIIFFTPTATVSGLLADNNTKDAKLNSPTSTSVASRKAIVVASGAPQVLSHVQDLLQCALS